MPKNAKQPASNGLDFNATNYHLVILSKMRIDKKQTGYVPRAMKRGEMFNTLTNTPAKYPYAALFLCKMIYIRSYSICKCLFPTR